MSGRKRCNLRIRLQPFEGTMLAEVIEWLNKMPSSEKNQKISQILAMTCIPLARADRGANQSELEQCYLKFEEWFYHYQFVVKDRLKIDESRIQDKSQTENNLNVNTMSLPSNIQEKNAKDLADVASSEGQFIGEGKVKNASSIFEGFG